MATPYSGELRFVGSACGTGTCAVEIDDAAEWKCSPEGISLFVNRLPSSREPVSVELLDEPYAGKTATAELHIDQQRAHFTGTEAFRS